MAAAADRVVIVITITHGPLLVAAIATVVVGHAFGLVFCSVLPGVWHNKMTTDPHPVFVLLGSFP